MLSYLALPKDRSAVVSHLFPVLPVHTALSPWKFQVKPKICFLLFSAPVALVAEARLLLTEVQTILTNGWSEREVGSSSAHSLSSSNVQTTMFYVSALCHALC